MERWPLAPLGEVADEVFLGLSLTRRLSQSAGDLYPVLSVGDLADGQVTPSAALQQKRLVLTSADERRYRLRADDILVAAKGTVLKVARAGEDSLGAIVSATLIIVRTSRSSMSSIIFAAAQSKEFTRQLAGYARSSTSTLSWTPQDVEKVTVPVPPVEVQQRIARLITATDEYYRLAREAAHLRRVAGYQISIAALALDGEATK
jgi:Type I restriction modification DNA specificity domain